MKIRAPYVMLLALACGVGLCLSLAPLAFAQSDKDSRQAFRFRERQQSSADRVNITVGPPEGAGDDLHHVHVEALTKEQVAELLKHRLSGDINGTFGEFASMFVASSKVNLGTVVSFVSLSDKIMKARLTARNPLFYQPTLGEFLDTIGQETSSVWSYEPTGKFFYSKVKSDEPVSGIAAFEFTEAPVQPHYEMTLASGWKFTNKGYWVTYSPATFPVGLEVYDLGTYSASDPAQEETFLKSVPERVALEWARRVKSEVSKEELRADKVADYNAVLFEAKVPGQSNQTVHWRQWVFMSGNRCFLIISAALPEFEDRIYPDVKAMLKSFKGK